MSEKIEVYDKIVEIPKISRIKIKDYGIIKNAVIDFKEGLNIITGKTASGKTTVIRYLTEQFNSKNLPYNEKTVLIDDVLGRLNKEEQIKYLNKLSNKRQVIITIHDSELDRIKDSIKANIIDTKNFELR